MAMERAEADTADAPPQAETAAAGAPAHEPELRAGGPLRAATALQLQRAAGNAAVARLVDAQPAPLAGAARPGGARGDRLAAHELARAVRSRSAQPAPAPPVRLLQRDDRKPPYTVVPALEADDKNRRFLDPADNKVKPVWTEEGGYVKNPSARPLKDVIVKGKVGGGFENGTYTYVVNGDGDVVLAKRLGEPGGGPGRATGMPHPTLIGGKNPTVLAAGEVEIRGGRIYKLDNQSGHFQPARKSMSSSVKAFLKVPTTAFHPEFKAESVHYDPAGARTTKPFKSMSMLKLRARDLKSSLRVLKPKAIMGRFKSRSFRSGAKTAGGAIAGVLVGLALSYLLDKLQDWIDEKLIDKQIDELAPRVEEELGKHEDQLDALLEEDSEKDLFLNVRFHIAYPQVHTGNFETPGGPVMMRIPPVVHLQDAGYSRVAWDPKPIEEHESACGAKVDSVIVTASQAVNPLEFFAPDESAAPQGTPEPAAQ